MPTPRTRHVLLALALVLPCVSPAADEPAAPVARFAGDRLTVHMTRVPVSSCVRALEEATGADVRGRIPTDGEVSIDLTDVPLVEALERMFGASNFVVTYREDGRPAAIELLGAPLPAVARRDPARDPKPQAAPADAPWPPDPDTAQAVATLQDFLQRDPAVKVDGQLAETLGTRDSTFKDVLRAATTHEDRRVRSRAFTAALRTLQDDRPSWAAFERVVATAPEGSMRDFAANLFGTNAEELTRQLSGQLDPSLRSTVRAVADDLARSRDAPSGKH